MGGPVLFVRHELLSSLLGFWLLCNPTDRVADERIFYSLLGYKIVVTLPGRWVHSRGMRVKINVIVRLCTLCSVCVVMCLASHEMGENFIIIYTCVH